VIKDHSWMSDFDYTGWPKNKPQTYVRIFAKYWLTLTLTLTLTLSFIPHLRLG